MLHTASLLLLALVEGLCSSDLPGVELQIGDRGVDVLAGTAVTLLDERLPGFRLPDAEGDFGPLIKGTFRLSDIIISKFSVESKNVELSFEAQKGVKTKIAGLEFQIDGSYEVDVKELVEIKKKGTLRANTEGATAEVVVEMASLKGHPRLEIFECSLNLGHFAVDLEGGLVDKILDIFKRLIAGGLKRRLDLVVCDKLVSAVAEEVDTLLQTMALEVTFLDGFRFDFGLTSDPRVGTDSISVPLQGKFWFTGHENDSSMPRPSGSLKPLSRHEMVCVSLDAQGVFGSAAYAFQKSPRSRFVVDSDILKHLPAKVRDFFHCDCPDDLCIGAILPTVRKHCRAGASLQFELNATAVVSPIVANSSGVFATLRTNGTFELLFPDQTRFDLSDIGSETVVLLEDSLHVEDGSLKGRVRLISTEVSVIYSSFGPISKYFLNLIWDEAVSYVIRGTVNPLLEKGIQLPRIPHFDLANSSINFGDNQVFFCSDFVLSLE
ncbi:hypothetical protein QR680_013023 [Steinernema hermaphroditum]|uniref:Lipid-binding serum glycoprotein C-terminal domain-containing protein n=1 Tax=Steinernema hermaphroditum TaxID=289476 RepID=A0AA39I6Q4_9BILA|nr:hypothetical protein QR680_013023 [Steinernema hermaphroditum]